LDINRTNKIATTFQKETKVKPVPQIARKTIMSRLNTGKEHFDEPITDRLRADGARHEQCIGRRWFSELL